MILRWRARTSRSADRSCRAAPRRSPQSLPSVPAATRADPNPGARLEVFRVAIFSRRLLDLKKRLEVRNLEVRVEQQAAPPALSSEDVVTNPLANMSLSRAAKGTLYGFEHGCLRGGELRRRTERPAHFGGRLEGGLRCPGTERARNNILRRLCGGQLTSEEHGQTSSLDRQLCNRRIVTPGCLPVAPGSRRGAGRSGRGCGRTQPRIPERPWPRSAASMVKVGACARKRARQANG